jgi:hypothetical protein
MSLWEWLLSIVWHGLDVLLHLWRIDREMREGEVGRRRGRFEPRAQAQATTGDAMMGWLLEIIELFLLDIVFELWGLGNGTLPTPPHAVRGIVSVFA